MLANNVLQFCHHSLFERVYLGSSKLLKYDDCSWSHDSSTQTLYFKAGRGVSLFGQSPAVVHAWKRRSAWIECSMT